MSSTPMAGATRTRAAETVDETLTWKAAASSATSTDSSGICS